MTPVTEVDDWGEVQDCLRFLASTYPIVGSSVTAYDPDCDLSGRGMSVTFELIEAIASHLGEGR